MAKKQSINYGPDSALIQGARNVAQSEVMMDSVGGTAFAKGFTATVLTGIEAQKQRDDKMDSYLDDLGSIENINKLEEGYNKDAVTQFLRNGRDEYARLAEQYEKTKDRSIRDKMDAIKFSFSNLNAQLDALVGERKQYADAYDKKQLVTLENGDEIYTDIYTNRSQFNIEGNGDLGFGSGDSYKKFKDIAGKWNVKNNIGETFTLQQNLNATKLGEAGKTFYRNDTKNAYAAAFKQTGVDGIMVMSKTDLTGDDQYVVGQDKDGNDILAGSMSFESMWSQGILNDKFYKQIPKGTDSKWMYDKKNIDTLNNLMSDYYTDVTESSYNQGRDVFNTRQQQARSTTGKAANFIIGGQIFNATDWNSSFVPFINKLAEPSEGETFVSPTGVKLKYEKGKYYKMTGVNKYNMDNPMEFKDVAVLDGWANYLPDNSKKTTTGGGAADSL